MSRAWLDNGQGERTGWTSGVKARCTYLIQPLSERKTRANKHEGYMDRLCVGTVGNIDKLLADNDATDGDIAAGTTAEPRETGNAMPLKLSEPKKLRLWT